MQADDPEDEVVGEIVGEVVGEVMNDVIGEIEIKVGLSEGPDGFSEVNLSPKIPSFPSREMIQSSGVFVPENVAYLYVLTDVGL